LPEETLSMPSATADRIHALPKTLTPPDASPYALHSTSHLMVRAPDTLDAYTGSLVLLAWRAPLSCKPEKSLPGAFLVST